MKLVYLVVVILYSKESQSEIISYPTPGSGMSFLCGCASATQYNKNIPIQCKDGGAILVEDLGFNMRDSIGNSSDCVTMNYARCSAIFRPTLLNLEDRLDIYKKCSLKNSCDIKIAGVQHGKVRLVNYPFFCQLESTIHDISRVIDKDVENHLLYFNGEKHIGRKIDCDCSVNSSTRIRLDVNFINLKPRTSSKVKILTQNILLFESSINGITMFYSKHYIGTDLKLEIRGLEPDVEDVIIFGILNVGKMTIKCGGCTTSADAELTTDASTHPNTTVHSTLYGSKGLSHVATTIMGGILAAVLVINIAGIALYCFIRRRKKQHNKSDTLAYTTGNGEQSLYENLEIRQDTQESGYARFYKK